MSKKVKIITDSGSDILLSEAKEYDIEVIPFLIYIDGKEYKTGIDISAEEFYEAQKNCKEVPKTSLVAPEVIFNTFKKFAEEDMDIFVLSLSSSASGFYNSARLASEMLKDEFPDVNIKIFDTQKFAYIYAYAAIKAASMSKEGKTLDEIYDYCENFLKDYEVYALPESLVYLEKGGRINKASLIFGSALDLKPIISIREGIIESIGMLRGSKKLPQKLIKKVKESGAKTEGKPIIIVNGAMDEQAQELSVLAKEELGASEVLIRPIGPTIATHVGPVFGLFFAKQ